MFFKHTFIVLLIWNIFNLPLAISFGTLYANCMQYLAITLPGGRSINPPAGIPTGGYNTVAKVVGNAITLILLVIVIFTLVMLIVGGLAWIQSGGDKQKVTQARARLTYAIVGLIVALASFFILNVIGFIFKVNLLQIG